MRWPCAWITIAAAAVGTAAAAAAQVAVPPAHQPVAPGASAPAGDMGRAAPARLVFALPAAWAREQPSSGMRLAQAKIPGRAVSLINDRYVAHHASLGGAAYIYFDNPAPIIVVRVERVAREFHGL